MGLTLVSVRDAIPASEYPPHRPAQPIGSVSIRNDEGKELARLKCVDLDDAKALAKYIWLATINTDCPEAHDPEPLIEF